MKQLIRAAAGTASAGEKEEQLRARATRRLNAGLDGERQISDRRARAYWHGEIDDVPSHHMDRARDLAAIQPIEEVLDAVDRAEQWIDDALSHGPAGLADRVLAGLHARLADRVRGAAVPAGDARAVGSDPALSRAERRVVSGRRRAAGMETPFSLKGQRGETAA